MRILSVTAQKMDSTGSGVFLTELTRGFDKLGHFQAVVCGMAPEDTLCPHPGVEVFPVCYKTEALPFPVCGMSDEMPYESTRYRDLTEEMTGRLFAAFRAKIREAVETFRPDVILCHHLYFLAAMVREMYPNLPIYGQCHGSDLRQIKKNPWQRDWIAGNIRNLDGIFALHAQQKETILETFDIPQEKVFVLGTGYNSGVFYLNEEAKSRKNSARQRLIFAGKLSEKKGLCSLLRALSHLKHPERYEVALAGGYGNLGEYRQICHLAECAPCRVTFLGRLNHGELALEMNNSDIFVLPSFYEGLPLVLIEAMACGLKTVCTDLPGIRPWLDRAIPENGTVFVAPPRMHNEDEPYPEDLPAFETRLARAIETAEHCPLPEPESISRVSWDSLCRAYCGLWQS